MKVSIFALLIALVGCSTYSKRECSDFNYRSIGFEDGKNGDDPTLDHYEKECVAEHGIPIDEQAFNKGYKAGLKTYCIEEQGESVGTKGQYPESVCKNDQNYLSGHGNGVSIFCQTANGYSFGSNGGKYNGICKGKTEDAFLAKYQLGRIEWTSDRIAALEASVDKLSKSNERKDERIKKLEDDLEESREETKKIIEQGQ